MPRILGVRWPLSAVTLHRVKRTSLHYAPWLLLFSIITWYLGPLHKLQGSLTWLGTCFYIGCLVPSFVTRFRSHSQPCLERYTTKLIGHNTHQLCHVCRRLPFLKLMAGPETWDAPIPIGSLGSILATKSCSLCRLIVAALDHGVGGPDAIRKDSFASVTFTNDYTCGAIMLKVKMSTGREGWISLFDVDDPDPQIQEIRDAYLSLPRVSYMTWNCRAIRDDIVDTTLIREWLTECQQGHRQKCSSVHEGASSSLTSIMLVDVDELKLVSADTSYEYVALSYVWGSVSMFKTMERHLGSLAQPASLRLLMDQIPPVIQNAITLTKDLGKRYLWVDSLCIVQDGSAKYGQLKGMDKIFGSSVLTVVALSGSDANTHLPGVVPGTRPSPPETELVYGLRCAPLSPPLTAEIKHAYHSTRAWTFQETLLPTRCLYFSDTKVYFRCHSGIRIEDRTGTVEDLDHSCNPLSRFRNPADDYDKHALWKNGESWSDWFLTYSTFVDEYTQRRLTYESDIENAFLGILSALEQMTKFKGSVACLPEKQISRSLLWISKGTAVRRSAGHAPSQVLPSWSWIGWEGQADYSTLIHETFRDSSLLSPMRLRDCLGQVQVIEGGASRELAVPSAELPHTGFCSVKFAVPGLLTPVSTTLPTAATILRFTGRLANASRFTLNANLTPTEHGHMSPTLTTKRFPNTVTVSNSWRSQCGLLTFHNAQMDGKGAGGKKQYFLAVASFRSNNLAPAHTPYYLHSYKSSKSWCKCLLQVLLIEEKGPHFERVAVGQMHPEAFESAGAHDRVVQLI